jgi:hypothetical protein
MKYHESTTITGSPVPFRGTLRIVLLALLCLAALGQQAGAQVTYALSNALAIATGTGNLTGSSTAVRGIAYNVVSNQVLAANASSGSIDAFDGSAGTLLGALSVSGVSGGTFNIDQVGVAADGTIYAVNLSTASTSANKVYQWANWQATPTVAFTGNALANGGSISLTSGRIGDTLAVTGSGTNTLLLGGIGSQKAFVLFYTTDGLSFNPVIVNVPSGYTAGGNIFGLCFFTNNTFLVKSASSGGSTVYLIQYPANFASSTVVTGTVLGTTSLGSTFNYTTLLSYAPASGLLAAVETGNSPSGVSPIGLFSLTNITAGATLLTTSNATTAYAGGNASGGLCINGTNSIYELTTGNPLYNYAILSIPPVPPSISTAPAAGTSYASDTLSVTATGTQPFSYRWLASTNDSATASTFTNIPGATSSTLTITAGTNYYEVIITNVAGSVTSTPVQVAILTPVTNAVVTNLWHVAIGASGYSYLANDNDSRGLAYDTNRQRLVVASLTGGSGLYILDANTGTNIGTLSLTNVTFGGLLSGVDQVGIGDDGVVYAGNLVSGSGFVLYSWPAATNNAPGTLVFQDSGSLGGSDRWGDTMAVRGAGANTQIILGSRSGTNVALLTTSDGVNFSGAYIAITNAPAGFAANGIAFGAGNTLWAKAVIGALYEIAFDPVNLVGGVVLDYPNPSEIPSYQVGVGIDASNNIMAGIDLSDVPQDLKLYELTGNSDAPVLYNQAFFASANANGNANAAIAMKYPRVYGLDVNNGLVALSYGVPANTPPSITTPPANQTVYTNDTKVVLQVSVSGSLPMHYQWQFSASSNGPFANLSLATNSTYTLSQPGLSKAGYYQVIAHNLAGYATSAPPALLTVLLPMTSTVVTQLWTIPGGGSLSFLDSSTYDTRGIAYDTNTAQVVIADNQNLHLLNATNGAYLGDLNSAGVFDGGYAGWLYDQVGVADDGTLYAGNLALTGTGYSIVTWSPGFAVGSAATTYAYGGGSGADPGNGSGDRWGDTMAVRGSGTGTEILIGSYSTNVVLFTTTDGQTFTANLIEVTNVPAGFSEQGIAFGAGDTFWTKSSGYNLRQVSFNRTAWTGAATQVFTAGTQFPSAFDGIAVDVGADVLAGVNFGNSPNDAELYLLSGNTNPPALFDQVFFGSANINGQLNAATTLKAGLGFSLDVNNGVVAFSYGLPVAPGVSITSLAYAPGQVTVYWNNVFSGHSYQLQSATNLAHPTWVNVGAPVSTSNPIASAVDTSSAAVAKFYRVIND